MVGLAKTGHGHPVHGDDAEQQIGGPLAPLATSLAPDVKKLPMGSAP
ncbi:hypothetical protein [Nonomuraea wenchangensis]